MKLMSFVHAGRPGYGVVVGDGIVDLGKAFGGRYPDLKALLEAGAVDRVAAAIEGHAADLALADVDFAPLIPNPGKIWCAGLNYGEHVRETGRDAPEKPMYFLRFADSQVGHEQAI